jgi:hypothetical protein
MNPKRVAKVQKALESQLEQGEQVLAEVAGYAARNMWQIILLIGPLGMALLGRYRNYVLTDRNIYVCKSNLLTGVPSKVLLKEPRSSGKLELTKTGLALGGQEPLYVGKVIRKRAGQLYEQAQQQPQAAPAAAPAT